MSKREVTTRQILIIKKLHRVKQATFDEIADHLEIESDIHGYNFNITQRTFQRDIRDIDSIYGIEIKYDKSEKSYFIKEELEPEINERLFEAFNVYNMLKMNEQNREYISLEKRQAQGTEHLFTLLNAIKKRLQVNFSYQKFYREKPEFRTVNPLMLKEFQHRWYLIARKENDKQIRRYALDRIINLEISTIHFPKDTDFDIDKMYKHCFGIIYPGDEKPQKIVLSFDPFQGKYIKSLPLHETQKILIDNDKELRISLNMYLTYDFKMELLSYGKTVKVIEPQPFAEEIKESYRAALEKY